MTREDVLADTFVQLADSLVDDFDIIDLLTVLADRCVEILDASAVGILLADSDGNLRVVAASSEDAFLLELFQLQNDEGPCVETHSTGEAVTSTDLRSAEVRWPRFSSNAVAAGFLSVYALPLRLRTEIIGALNLFRTDAGAMADADVKVAQALADVATIAILQDQATRETRIRAGELQHALDSRVLVEQAKGVLAERMNIAMSDAFDRIRSYARTNRLRLSDVASSVVDGTLTVEALPDPSSVSGAVRHH